MVVRWRFEDPVTLEVHTFEINPTEGGSPSHRKTISGQAAAAPDGKALLFEGREQVQTLEWSGAILTQQQFEAFDEWSRKRHQINVVDDLRREFSIIITSFEPTRVRSRQYPWRHTYRMQATIVDWA